MTAPAATAPATMRDAFIEGVYQRMAFDDSIFFLSADFGAPRLDDLRGRFPGRFINVGIAEQNLISVAAGLALEGYTVYTYAIASFGSMRAYEQIRVDLSLMAQLRPKLNVNMLSVGAGLSYDVSGPTHHCFEDIGLMRMLPHMTVLSPSDPVLAGKMLAYTLDHPTPKYLRFDGKPLPNIYRADEAVDIAAGFHRFHEGRDVCVVATGYMTHKALRLKDALAKEGLDIGVIDCFLLKPFDEAALAKALSSYSHIVTLEEAFVGKGGLDGMILSLIHQHGLKARLRAFGFEDRYIFEIGDRETLHDACGVGFEELSRVVSGLAR